jgi:deazaflavin-dependent oxidoreductase (nitroreductase family)
MPLDGEYEPGTADRARRQAERYEATNGAEGGAIGGRPVIVLTSRGARTGKLRKTVLMRVEHDGRYAVVASLAGSARNPNWYTNVRNHPLVELQDGAVRRDYLAREVSGDEKLEWWDRAVAAFPLYADYQRRTRRQIPVLVLEPLASEDDR